MTSIATVLHELQWFYSYSICTTVHVWFSYLHSYSSARSIARTTSGFLTSTATVLHETRLVFLPPQLQFCTNHRFSYLHSYSSARDTSGFLTSTGLHETRYLHSYSSARITGFLTPTATVLHESQVSLPPQLQFCTNHRFPYPHSYSSARITGLLTSTDTVLHETRLVFIEVANTTSVADPCPAPGACITGSAARAPLSPGPKTARVHRHWNRKNKTLKTIRVLAPPLLLARLVSLPPQLHYSIQYPPRRRRRRRRRRKKEEEE